MSGTSEDALLDEVASLIARENVIGWFNGRMEFGPRALGSRSILADPRSPRMQAQLNVKIKFREGFRPFAPSVLRERVRSISSWTATPRTCCWSRRCNGSGRSPWPRPAAALGHRPSERAAVRHPGSDARRLLGRIQTVDGTWNRDYYDLIRAFERQTGCAVLINTSFNVRGEPIVCTPADAYRCFMRTNMDYLVLGPFLLDRAAQPEYREDADWKLEFELD
jgi:carbamoyltransferase